MARGTAGLAGRLNDAWAPLPSRPVGRDTFQFSRITLRFLRDNAGNAVGPDFSNPVLGKIGFTRVSDGDSGPIALYSNGSEAAR